MYYLHLSKTLFRLSMLMLADRASKLINHFFFPSLFFSYLSFLFFFLFSFFLFSFFFFPFISHHLFFSFFLFPPFFFSFSSSSFFFSSSSVCSNLPCRNIYTLSSTLNKLNKLSRDFPSFDKNSVLSTYPHLPRGGGLRYFPLW